MMTLIFPSAGCTSDDAKTRYSSARATVACRYVGRVESRRPIGLDDESPRA